MKPRKHAPKKHVLEAGLLRLMLNGFRLLPLDAASWLMGFLARLLGPMTGAQKNGNRNLKTVMPELSGAERRRILSQVWDNLGRVSAEMPFLGSHVLAKRITVRNPEVLHHVRESGKPAIFVAGHYGNWEVATWVANLHGIALNLIYRAANNKAADDLIQSCRANMKVTPMPGTPEGAANKYFKKGRRALLGIVQALEAGQSVGMLIDQKFNDGLELPFMGHPAMTATTAVELAMRYNVPVVPFRAVRHKGVHFTTELHDPIFFPEGTSPADAMGQLHSIMEGWIREHPGQWLWLHKRWKTA
ncbi:lauroyl acyltransferase [bacterium]|nr:lauroyl acyltransferase [bacterium]